jgi:hypothetical protein
VAAVQLLVGCLPRACLLLDVLPLEKSNETTLVYPSAAVRGSHVRPGPLVSHWVFFRLVARRFGPWKISSLHGVVWGFRRCSSPPIPTSPVLLLSPNPHPSCAAPLPQSPAATTPPQSPTSTPSPASRRQTRLLARAGLSLLQPQPPMWIPKQRHGNVS